MTTAMLYSLTGIIIMTLGFRGVIIYRHFLRKVLAINVVGTGIFMMLIALADRNANGSPDPIPHAMVLTGIVVAVSATAFILALIVRLFDMTGQTSFEEIHQQQKKAKHAE